MPNYQIRADVFPASIKIVDSSDNPRYIEKARVIITLDHVYVFEDAQPKPEITYEDRLTAYTPPVKATRVRKAVDLMNRYAIIETEEGDTVTFQRMSSCGCGSRLKTATLSSLLPNNGIGQAASTNDS